MTESVDVVVIGGGQAGLAISYYLTQQGRPHVVLEQHRLGEAWRSQRWDSFTLVTPNWMLQLPGFSYQGDNPDEFLPREQVITFLEQYVATFNPPLHTGIHVTRVESTPGESAFRVLSDQVSWTAPHVVVATGTFQAPRLPASSTALPPDVYQLHSSQYRNPGALPPGAVLVVGSGQSGCQIAEELYQGGRQVYLAVGRCGRLPRRYRGQDANWWLNKMGPMTVDRLPSPQARFACNPHVSGKNGGHDLNLHQFARDGVTLLGRLVEVQDGRLILAPNLAQNLAFADQFAADFKKGVDAFVQKAGLAVPEEPIRADVSPGAEATGDPIRTLDLRAAGITTVIWATGYAWDFSWVTPAPLDATGYPIHQRGVTPVPGLYFLGLHWLYTPASGLIFGVGDDAAYIATQIAE